ncbi:restriction endonuclease [uncultured Chitinophaga sp.]|uniref:restriction endonuclease n=1 Tax=uncultured Chitinophaga sp. TaxID=339340 RepID=UPI0025CDC404|nr:restriction endonuclease [uncultured Chitinophaga sp.]
MFGLENEELFTGRRTELQWLDRNLYSSDKDKIITICGQSGYGKTALLKHWFVTNAAAYEPIWISTKDLGPRELLDEIMLSFSAQRNTLNGQTNLVVIDDAGSMTTEKQQSIKNYLFSNRDIDTTIFLRDTPSNMLARHLEVGPLTDSDARRLLLKVTPPLLFAQSEMLLQEAAGSPAAIIRMAQHFADMYSVPLYDLPGRIIVPETQIISTYQPLIVAADSELIARLKKEPSAVHSLSPRDFEKMLAELLQDMGWEVELTKQTRDGGADILARRNSEEGKVLCLVEAKKYREDRKIGVELVRTLYGTLCDARATRAMMVTTSSFTADARAFEKKHEYQLSLRDYMHLVNWILKYGNAKK